MGDLLAQVARTRAAAAPPGCPVVDADLHVECSLRELAPFVDQPWRRQVEVLVDREGTLMPVEVADESVGGRIRRGEPDSFSAVRDAFGFDRAVVLPGKLMSLGLHPQVSMEVALARAYARWAVEAFLPDNDAARAMLYLPLNDPDASVRMIREFGERRGVVGFVVGSMRHQPVHENRFMPVYAALEERNLALGFHPSPLWQERQLEIFNRFLSAAAIGYPLYNTVHLINLVVHGIPERFPRLRLIFYEAGISWLPFVYYRLDGEVVKRVPEAPLLRRKPSEYIREFFFTTQPLEAAGPKELEALMRIAGTDHLLYGSNYPRWDFDLPERIAALDFLSPGERAAILGGNAVRAFGLD